MKVITKNEGYGLEINSIFKEPFTVNMKTYLLAICLLFSPVFILAQRPMDDKIDLNSVESGSMEYTDPKTNIFGSHQLSQEDIELFITSWNHPVKVDLVKIGDTYKVELKLKDGNTRQFILWKKYIKDSAQETDLCVITSSNLGFQLWQNKP